MSNNNNSLPICNLRKSSLSESIIKKMKKKKKPFSPTVLSLHNIYELHTLPPLPCLEWREFFFEEVANNAHLGDRLSAVYSQVKALSVIDTRMVPILLFR